LKVLGRSFSKVGLSEQMDTLVMARVTSVRLSIRFNMHMLDSFSTSCGLRQGDLFSPYLFLFVADGMSCLIRRKTKVGALHEFQICRRAPSISHLFFENDSLLFFEEYIGQATVIKSILDIYERSVG
jgi:hypothetical protein